MECCNNKDERDVVAARKTEAINATLAKERSLRMSDVKLLLLGAGESGKSTVAKQLKIIHKNGFQDNERKQFIGSIHSNIITSLHMLMDASVDFGIDFADPTLAEDCRVSTDRLGDEMAPLLQKLWEDAGTQELYRRRAEFQLPDSFEFFVNNIERILSPKYVPTEEDILRTRVQTTGIVESEFVVGDTKFALVDVGGQRSERRKWMYCFEGVTAVLFVVSLSGFNMTLYEDYRTNRMVEALRLFHEICSSKWFSRAAMILFLNKVDLFMQKIKDGCSITTAFPSYNGDKSFEASLEYIQDRFMDITDPVTRKPKNIYPHVTCATDTENVKKVFEAVQDYTLRQAVMASQGM